MLELANLLLLTCIGFMVLVNIKSTKKLTLKNKELNLRLEVLEDMKNGLYLEVVEAMQENHKKFIHELEVKELSEAADNQVHLYGKVKECNKTNVDFDGNVINNFEEFKKKSGEKLHTEVKNEVEKLVKKKAEKNLKTYKPKKRSTPTKTISKVEKTNINDFFKDKSKSV
tara:strand:- start:458 stop:967 length:510 start_codon:yes stop_codon:yes gene_type:complete